MKRPIINFQENTPANIKPLSAQIKMALEAEDIYQESVQDLRDNDKALDIAQTLEDLHIVLNDIDKQTATQVALIKSIANTAVLGSDIEPNNVIPAIEDINENPLETNSLLERAGLVFNIYLQTVNQSFENIIKQLSTILSLTKQNLDMIEGFKRKFAIPDNPNDDIERSVKFDEQDKQYMITAIGLANSFGDLFNCLRNSRKSFKNITDVSINISNRLLDSVGQMMPSDKVTNADEMIFQMHTANKNLFDSIQQLWQVAIGKSDLLGGPTNNDYETYESSLLLGGEKINFEIKRLVDLNNCRTDYNKRSEFIQSFKMTSLITPQESNKEELILAGITNKSINLFIEEIKMFATDLDRYIVWCMTTAEMAKSRSSRNIANITQYYDKSNIANVTPEQNNLVRSTIQNHIADIRNMVKMIDSISCIPARYGNDLLTGLVSIIDKMPKETPVGSYNALK